MWRANIPPPYWPPIRSWDISEYWIFCDTMIWIWITIWKISSLDPREYGPRLRLLRTYIHMLDLWLNISILGGCGCSVKCVVWAAGTQGPREGPAAHTTLDRTPTATQYGYIQPQIQHMDVCSEQPEPWTIFPWIQTGYFPNCDWDSCGRDSQMDPDLDISSLRSPMISSQQGGGMPRHHPAALLSLHI